MPRTDPIPELKRQVGAALAERLTGWNAHDVAFLIGTDQPRVSDIRRGKLDRFSLETLIRYLSRMQRRVELRIVENDSLRRARAAKRASRDADW
jgi:predicted XRE-type DNA-binding protein